MKKFAALITISLGLAAFSNTASAITATCSLIQSEIAAGVCTGTCITNNQQTYPECFGTTSSTAAATQEIRSTSFRQMLAISQAFNARNLSRKSAPAKVSDNSQRFGLAAGNPGSQWNVWGSLVEERNKYDGAVFANPLLANTWNKNTSSTSITNGVIGSDYQITPTMAVGLSAAFDSGTGAVVSFEGPTPGALTSWTTTLSTSGYTIAPYLGWQINQDWTLDASLGLGSVKLNSSETASKADRLFYGANLNYVKWDGNWQLAGKGSYLHGEEKYGNISNFAVPAAGAVPGTASTNKLDQLAFGGQAGYWVNDGVMPYFGLNYSSDLSRSTSGGAQAGTDIGRNALVFSLGVNFFSLKNDLTGGIAYNQETGRTYSKNNSLLANINYRF